MLDQQVPYWRKERLAVYAYHASHGDLPLLLLVKEWEHGALRGASVAYCYEHSEDYTPERRSLSRQMFCFPLDSDEITAKLIAEGMLLRVGDLPDLPLPKVDLREEGPVDVHL